MIKLAILWLVLMALLFGATRVSGISQETAKKASVVTNFDVQPPIQYGEPYTRSMNFWQGELLQHGLNNRIYRIQFGAGN